MATDTSRPTASISHQIVDPAVFNERVDAIRGRIVEAGCEQENRGALAGPADNHAAPLHARMTHFIDSIYPAAPTAHPGWRGKAAYLAKVGVRRVIYWYVEPSWRSQRQLNQELFGIVTTHNDEIARLQADVRWLESELKRVMSRNLVVQRERSRLRRSQKISSQAND